MRPFLLKVFHDNLLEVFNWVLHDKKSSSVLLGGVDGVGDGDLLRSGREHKRNLSEEEVHIDVIEVIIEEVGLLLGALRELLECLNRLEQLFLIHLHLLLSFGDSF